MPTSIEVEFRFDRWEVIRRYGYRETLIAFRDSESAANELAAAYREVE